MLMIESIVLCIIHEVYTALLEEDCYRTKSNLGILGLIICWRVLAKDLSLMCFDSDGSFPNDEGASQEVSESLFIGESKNYGFQGGQNKYVGTGGIDNKTRTLPRNR